MPARSQVLVEFKAKNAELRRVAAENEQLLRKFGSTAKAEIGEARGSFALLGDEIGVRLPRHLQTFLAEIPGVGQAMAAAFSTIAVIGLITVVVEAGKKVSEFIQKNEEAAKKNAAAWTSLHTSVSTQNDDLELTKIKLENAIAKLEHKPANKLAEAIAEARVEADKLGSKIDEVVKQIQEAVKGEQSSGLSKLLLHQTGGTATGKVLEELQLKLQNIDNGFVKGDPTQLRQDALKEAHDALQPIIQASHATVAQLQKNGVSLDHSSSRVEYETASGADRNIQGLLGITGNSQAVSGLQGKLSGLQDAKAATSERLKAIEDEFKNESLIHQKSLQEQEDFWTKYLNAFKYKTDEWRAVAEHWTQAHNAVAAELFHDVMEFQKPVVETELQIPRQPEDKDYQKDQRAAKDASDEHQKVLFNQYQQWITTTAGATINALNLLSQSFTDTAHMVSDVLMQSLSNFNDTVVHVLSGDKSARFSDVGSQLFKSISGGALEQGEGHLLKALGLGGKHGKADGYHVWLDNLPGGGSGANTTASYTSGLLGFLNNSNWAGKLFGGSLFGSGGFFGGHAFGGPALAGVPINVGELGPETFVPSTPGYVIPHGQGGSSGMAIHVDARGSTDPAATQANAMRGIKAAVSASQQQQHEQSRRSLRRR